MHKKRIELICTPNTFGRVGGMERDVLTEQKINIKFLVKLSKCGQEILQMLDMVSLPWSVELCINKLWIGSRKEGRMSMMMRDSFSHVDENIQRVHDLAKADHRIIKMIAEKFGTVMVVFWQF